MAVRTFLLEAMTVNHRSISLERQVMKEQRNYSKRGSPRGLRSNGTKKESKESNENGNNFLLAEPYISSRKFFFTACLTHVHMRNFIFLSIGRLEFKQRVK